MGDFCGVKWNKSDKQKTARIVVWHQKLFFCDMSIKKKKNQLISRVTSHVMVPFESMPWEYIQLRLQAY